MVQAVDVRCLPVMISGPTVKVGLRSDVDFHFGFWFYLVGVRESWWWDSGEQRLDGG